MSYVYQKYESPAGVLFLIAKGERLRAVLYEGGWAKFRAKESSVTEAACPVLAETRRQLEEYFEGNRTSFDLPIELEGTDFQKQVWSSLATIPFGKTRTYKQQAMSVAAPLAVRAVGRTNGMNRLAIVLPCHRVIGTDGTLTGYAGGLEAKEYLLRLENALGQDVL